MVCLVTGNGLSLGADKSASKILEEIPAFVILINVLDSFWKMNVLSFLQIESGQQR